MEGVWCVTVNSWSVQVFNVDLSKLDTARREYVSGVPFSDIWTIEIFKLKNINPILPEIPN